jgi:hypothetical protein
VLLVLLLGNILLLFLLLTAFVLTVMWLVLPALEGFILNAQSVMVQLLPYGQARQNVEGYAQLDNIGSHQIIHANPVFLLVSIVLELELIIVTHAYRVDI